MNTHEDFRNIISKERENLIRLSDYWNSQIKCSPQNISTEDQGRIRAAVGKTRLLLAEKFKQFEGLVEQSANNTSEKEISINDLQGFWDLVSIQVKEVKEMFRSLGNSEEKTNSDVRKMAKHKNTDHDQREVNKTKSMSKKKLPSDFIHQTEMKLRDISEKSRQSIEMKDLKNKLSLSKL